MTPAPLTLFVSLAMFGPILVGGVCTVCGPLGMAVSALHAILVPEARDLLRTRLRTYAGCTVFGLALLGVAAALITATL